MSDANSLLVDNEATSVEGEEMWKDSKWTGLEFTQSEVETTLSMKHTMAQGDRVLFEPNLLNKARYKKIAKWLENPHGKYQAKFGGMSQDEFRGYKERIERRWDEKLKATRKAKAIARQGGDVEIEKSTDSDE